MRARTAAAALAAWLAAGTALAQQPPNAPVRLGPPGAAVQPAPDAAPPEDARSLMVPPDTAAPEGEAAAPAPVSAAPAPAASGPRRPAGLQVEELGALSAEGAGPLVPADGGLGADLWAGTPRDLVERLLASLPARSDSAAYRDLARRLLLSGGTLPQGDAGPRNLAGLRLERVALLGDAASANALVALAAPALEDEPAARAWMDVNLLAGDAPAACARVPELLGRFRHPEWQMYQVVCEAQAGRAAEATLALDLLREQGVKDDLFFRLAEAAAAGQKQPVKGVTDPTPAQLALIRASGRGLPADVKVDDPARLAALALSAETPLSVRLPAAERAAAYGALPARELAQIYKLVKLAPADLKDPVAAAGARKGPEARALLFQALGNEQVPTIKAELLKKAVELAEPGTLGGPLGELLAQEIGIVAPSPSLAFLAPHAARVHLLRGRADLARPWVELARTAGDEAAWHRLWPLAVLGGLARAGDMDMGRWLDGLKVAEDAEARAQAGAVLALLAAAGEAVDPAARARLVGGAGARGLVPDVTAWQRLAEAGPARRTGEAALLALVLLGEAGPARAPALPTAHAVQHLTAAGLRDPARRLASEAVAALLAP